MVLASPAYRDGPLVSSKRFTLMCRDHEALEFCWNVPERRVVGRMRTIDARYVPWGAIDVDGRANRRSLASWMQQRSIPTPRPHVVRRLRDAGIDDPETLLALGTGASLSDQYWLREAGSSLTWGQVSFFSNDFDLRLGQYLTAQDSQETARLAGAIARDLGAATRSPDTSLGGNLPKRWEVRDGVRVLVKRSSSAYGQEPMNEAIASRLCERLGIEHVPYEATCDGLTWESVCPCMVDGHTELVSAWHAVSSCQRRGDESRAAWYLRTCADHGLDASGAVERMLVVDYVLCNFDRHWSNFGVLVDTESRAWKASAPLFDMGESLWCDRAPAEGLGGYHIPAWSGARPFLHRIDEQLSRFCHGLSWLDAAALDGFGGEVAAELRRLPMIAFVEGRADAIGEAVDERVRRVARLADSRARARLLGR